MSGVTRTLNKRFDHRCSSEITRLNPFARSWFYNATAVRGTLWWLRQSHSVNSVSGDCHIQQQSHSVNYANHQHSPFARRRHDVANYIFPVSFGKSFMKIPFSRSRERLSHILADEKKTKKTSVKHIRNRRNVKHSDRVAWCWVLTVE